MTKQQKTELKWCAYHMRTMPVQASARFERLVREITPKDRRDLVDTLREILNDCTPDHIR